MRHEIRALLLRFLWRLPQRPLWAVYAATGDARALRLFEESLWSHPRDFVGRTRSGVRIQGNTRDVIQRYIYAFGVWEPEITEWLRGFLRPGDTVIDVGANIGYYSLQASQLTGPTGTVFAIEPVPSIQRLLHKNMALNGSGGTITVVPIVASDADGEVEVFRGADDNLGTSSTVGGDGYSAEGTVQAGRLDDVLGSADLRKLRLVKIDTEGDEARVLGGMPRILSQMAPGAAVLVEVAPDRLAERGLSEMDVWRHFPTESWVPFRVQNDYRVDSYVTRNLAAPLKIDKPQGEQADIIFLKR